MAERAEGGEGDGSAKPMSVVLVNQYYAPADAPTASLLADVGEALAADGHDVRAFCSRRGYRDATVKYPRREVIDGVNVRRVGGTGFTQERRWGRLVNYFAFFISIARQLLVTRKPDVIVSLSTPPLLASIVQAVASMRGARFIYWVMDVHPELAFRLGHLKKNSITGRILEWSGRRTLEKSDAVVALGDDMAELLRPFSNGSTTVIRTWTDGEHIRPRQRDGHPLRREWGWEGRFVVAYSGHMGLVHEFDTILDAAEHLSDDDRYLFCFIGDGPREPEVRREIARRRLTNVEFKKFVAQEQLPDSLTAIDVHLVSLRADLAGLSVPSKAYGAFAAGRPLAFVGPRNSDIGRIVVQEGCGVQIDNGDAWSLARALKAYAASAELSREHSDAAREAHDRRFRKQSSLDQLTLLVTQARSA